MTAGGDGTTRTPVAIWCHTCGIPYAPETAFCAICSAPLTSLDDELVAATPGAPTLSPDKAQAKLRAIEVGVRQSAALPAVESAVPLANLDSAQSAAQSAQLPAVRTLDDAFPNPPRGLLDRVRQRQQAMSDDEVDAAASAIIAQARHADRIDAATGDAPDALALLAGLAPDPLLDEALQRRAERDRAWLIGGIICCVLLILFALIISRTMSIGMLRQ